jgi:DNA-binding response OmpR family regulator
VRALLRRAERSQELDAVRIGDAEVSLEARTVTLDGRVEDLSSYEVELLRLFLDRPGQAVSRDDILNRVWGVQAINSRAVDNFIVKLRKKIEEDYQNPKHILTIYGVGYKLSP